MVYISISRLEPKLIPGLYGYSEIGVRYLRISTLGGEGIIYLVDELCR